MPRSGLHAAGVTDRIYHTVAKGSATPVYLMEEQAGSTIRAAQTVAGRLTAKQTMVETLAETFDSRGGSYVQSKGVM
jgi:hypothetical protein